jgi:hypothetical protein
MKTRIIIILAFLLACGRPSFAQEDSVITLPTITVTSTTEVPSIVNTFFDRNFPDAFNLSWYKYDKDYLARFIENDMDHKALFKKNGVLKYDVSFGYESNLPENVLQMVQGAYPDHKIIRTFRVQEGGRDIWVVNLESLNNYVIARVEQDQLEEVQRFNKS